MTGGNRFEVKMDVMKVVRRSMKGGVLPEELNMIPMSMILGGLLFAKHYQMIG